MPWLGVLGDLGEAFVVVKRSHGCSHPLTTFEEAGVAVGFSCCPRRLRPIFGSYSQTTVETSMMSSMAWSIGLVMPPWLCGAEKVKAHLGSSSSSR